MNKYRNVEIHLFNDVLLSYNLYVFIPVFIYLYIYSCIYLYIYLSIYLSIYLNIYLNIYLFIPIFIHAFIYLYLSHFKSSISLGSNCAGHWKHIIICFPSHCYHTSCSFVLSASFLFGSVCLLSPCEASLCTRKALFKSKLLLWLVL